MCVDSGLMSAIIVSIFNSNAPVAAHSLRKYRRAMARRRRLFADLGVRPMLANTVVVTDYRHWRPATESDVE